VSSRPERSVVEGPAVASPSFSRVLFTLAIVEAKLFAHYIV
jgi:hypothetical protein